MPLSNGCNHVTLVTDDIDRFIAFYRDVFEAEVVLDMDEGDLRHAMLDLGSGFALHPFMFRKGNPHGAASPAMFDRGHLDHVAIRVTDPDVFEQLRDRLVTARASDGTVTDFGRIRSVWFCDPDGMGGEIVISAEGAPRAFADRGREPYGSTVAVHE